MAAKQPELLPPQSESPYGPDLANRHLWPEEMPGPIPASQVIVAAETTPMSLLATYAAQGIDPEKLSKLMDLQERYEKGLAIKAFNEAMRLAQGEMPTIVCDSFNKQTSSKYASVESVNRACKPVYTKHGFALSFNEAKCDLEGHCRSTCEVMHKDGHSKDYYLDLPLDGIGIKGNANMTGIHGKLSSKTYAQSKLLREIFNLTVSEDDTDTDGNMPAAVTDEQWEEMNILLEETKHVGYPERMKKFLNWLGVEKLSDLGAEKFKKGITELRRIKEKK